MGCHIYAPGVSIGRSGVSTERRVRILRVDKAQEISNRMHWTDPQTWLGGGFKDYVFFHPYLEKWSNLTNIFQMGWNHQLAEYLIGPIRIFDGQK